MHQTSCKLIIKKLSSLDTPMYSPVNQLGNQSQQQPVYMFSPSASITGSPNSCILITFHSS